MSYKRRFDDEEKVYVISAADASLNILNEIMDKSKETVYAYADLKGPKILYDI